MRVATKILIRFQAMGLDNIPLSGPVIVVINHIALLDPVIVCGSLPRLATPLAKKEAFDLWIIGFLMRIYGTISIRRGEVDIAAIKAALRVLNNGGLILLAPEGTRSPTRQLQPAKEGAMMLALRSGAAIVPIGVTGTHQLKAHWKKFRRAPVSLSIGKPFYLCPKTKHRRVSRAEMSAMARETMYRLAKQLPKEYRGVYDDLEKATQTYLAPLES